MSAMGLKSDVPGVVWDASRNRWRAYGPGKDGKRVLLGIRKEKVDAERLRLSVGLLDKNKEVLLFNRSVRLRMRAVWREMTKSNKAHGWASFDHFVLTVGDRPAVERKLVALDEATPIGPENFQWVRPQYDFLSQDGRKKYLQTRYANNPRQYRREELRRKFGITLEQYEEMMQGQNGGCAICGQPETALRKGKVLPLCVDHNHRTGENRGLLCTACNIGIGSLAESPERLRAAIAYLDRWNAIETAPLPDNVVKLKS